MDDNTVKQSRTEFLAVMESQMQQWDEDVRVFLGRRKASGAMARGVYYEHMKELRAGRNAANKTLQQLQLLSEATDVEVRARMRAVWERMQAKLHEIAPEPGR